MPESTEPQRAAMPSAAQCKNAGASRCGRRGVSGAATLGHTQVLLYVLRRFLLAAMIGGIAAGIVSTAVQVGLWLSFTNAFPEILWRDVRLTAALFLGPAVLPPASADGLVLAAATMVHFGLSVIYGVVFCIVTCRLAWGSTASVAGVGTVLGMLLYFVNLYGFTQLFPWFSAARGWITLAAHLAFGASATVTCRWTLHRGRWEVLAASLAR